MLPYATVKEVMKLYEQWMKTEPVVTAGDFGEVLKQAPEEFLKWYKEECLNTQLYPNILARRGQDAE